MGLFDKLKSAVNSITGGGATVTVSASPGNQVGGPVKVKVVAVIKDQALNAAGVYLELRSVERVRFQTRVNNANVDINEERSGHSSKVNVSGSQTLEAGKTYEWESEINIPGGLSGTFHGALARHIWEINAGLDVSGNDPDSGWVEIQVKA